MPIEKVHRYTRAEIRARPGALYAFGDNLAGRGFGGQAREARGEPNAVGVVTKRRQAMDEGAFLTDADLPRVRPLIEAAFARLREHLEAGGEVILPADGLGTGLAELPRRAPAIAALIEAGMEALRES